jgi:DNA-binding IclR family transcriptional regulator
MAANVPAVASAIRILEKLAGEWPRSVSPGVLVEELGLNRSTCYNILATLQRAGWAASPTERAGWTLGPRLLTLTGVSHELVANIVQEELDELSRMLGYVAFAAERDGSDGYTVVARGERASGIRVTVGVGDRFPFSAPALLHAFGAWMPAQELERLVTRHGLAPFTPYTVTDPHALAGRLADVRRVGYSHSIRELDLAQAAIAATVFDNKGKAVLSIAVLAFSSEVDEERVDEVGRLVRSTADRITERIGGSPPVGYLAGGEHAHDEQAVS